ncbi:MAG TPA: hypothetical protein PL042_07075, partial [Caldisericia bacterium]|nr:hypothetical protein [Caldisericia bacterium]
MRKILAIILVALMALSFVPFRNTNQVEAATNKNATMITNALWNVTFNTPPVKSKVESDLRPYSFLWYATEYTPILGTDFYLTVISDASGSRLLDRYYAIVAYDDDLGLHLFIDPDTTFETPASTNNTKSWGPFSLGTTLSEWTIVIGGRNFVLNFIDIDDSGNITEGDGLVLFEVLVASCCGNEIIYDIGVESDVEPSYWSEDLPYNPLLAARLSKGTGTDIPMALVQQIEWSVAHRIGTTVFHNIKLTNREYIDLEIWFDDGYDIINNGYLLISHNTKDDYIPLTQAEEWLGVVDGNYGDITSQGQVIKGTDLFGRTLYFLDTNTNGIVDVGEFLLEPIEDELFFKVKNLIDVTDPNWTGLTPVITDVNVIDIDGSGDITAGDTVVANDVYWWNTPLLYEGLTMRYGDFRGFDIPVLPGKMNLDVKVYDKYPDGNVVDKVKVEQTYTIIVSLPEDCVLPPNAKVHIVAQVPGYYAINWDNPPDP